MNHCCEKWKDEAVIYYDGVKDSRAMRCTIKAIYCPECGSKLEGKKEIEKLKVPHSVCELQDWGNLHIIDLGDKINEIVDHLNKKENR